jgi:hypothetical protein
MFLLTSDLVPIVVLGLCSGVLPKTVAADLSSGATEMSKIVPVEAFLYKGISQDMVWARLGPPTMVSLNGTGTQTDLYYVAYRLVVSFEKSGLTAVKTLKRDAAGRWVIDKSCNPEDGGEKKVSGTFSP